MPRSTRCKKRMSATLCTETRQDAQFLAIVEHGSEIGTELHIGAADRAANQRDRVGVQRLLGRDRAELEDRLQAVADLGRIIVGLFSMSRNAGGHYDDRGKHSKVLTHTILPIWRIRSEFKSDAVALSRTKAGRAAP